MDQTLQLINVRVFRLYLSAKLPAINEVNANNIVKDVEANSPYCVSVNSKSTFMEWYALAVIAVVVVSVGKSTR